MNNILTTIQTNLSNPETVNAILGYFWLVSGVLLMIMEVGSPGLFLFLSFACGTFIAACLAFAGYSFMVQCISVIIISIPALIMLRLFFANEKKPQLKTNIQALTNYRGIVTKIIRPQQAGRVKIHGEEWSAITTNDQTFEVGSIVAIIEVRGNKVIVQQTKS